MENMVVVALISSLKSQAQETCGHGGAGEAAHATVVAALMRGLLIILSIAEYLSHLNTR